MPHHDAPDDLDAIAGELYALTPAEFTAARNARAAASDPATAKAVKALPKATVAAWAVGLLVRDGQLGEAIELSAALREAQEDLDAAELGRLGRQRRSLVAALAGQAVSLAEERGVAVSAAAREEVEKTINAAVMDGGAAAAVLSGRLVKTLTAGAFAPADLAAAVAGSPPEGIPAPPPRDDLAARRAQKAAEQAAREAERAAHRADRELAESDARLAKARERADHLAERLDDVRADLARLEQDEAAAREALARAEDARSAAASAARTAARNAASAQEAVKA